MNELIVAAPARHGSLRTRRSEFTVTGLTQAKGTRYVESLLPFPVILVPQRIPKPADSGRRRESAVWPYLRAPKPPNE